MSKQLKTKKILVKDGQELISKAKEYKNSGGEWKLLERYIEIPWKEWGKRKNKLGWGIIISNGKQTIDIFSIKNNIDYEELVEEGLVSLDEVNVRPEIWQLFPEAKLALSDSGNEKLNNATFKELKKDNEDYLLKRYLVAENFRHLKLIIRDYFGENETKIYQSSNRNFSDWVEIVDGQDGNIYLYVGEKNSNDGHEIKIGIKKSEFEKGKSSNFSANELLETSWKLLIMSSNEPKTPDEKKAYYYQGTEEGWQAIQKFWEQTCRASLEDLRGRMNEKLNYLEKELFTPDRDRELTKTRWQILTIDHRLKYMRENHPDWYNNYNKACPDCEMRMCCHKEGQPCRKNKQYLLENVICLQGGNISQPPVPLKPVGNTNQITETEKIQLLQYFLKNNIESIELREEKLVITYKSQSQETKIIKDEELKKIQKFLQNQPNRYLSLAQLQTNANHSNSEPNNHNSVIGLTIGAVILVGIIVIYLLTHKKKKSQ